MDVFGARLDPPGGEGIGGQAGLEPIGEGLRIGEVGGFGGRHIGDSEKPARVKRERDFGEEVQGGGFWGREEKEKREGGKDEVREGSDGFFEEEAAAARRLELKVVRRR